MNLTQAERTSGARLLQGRRSWWFLGPGGVARLNAGHLTPDGELRPGTEGRLRESGILRTTPTDTYSLTVLTSTSCNLGCAYCFQNIAQDPAGGSRPPRIATKRLTSQTITSVLDFTGRKMAEAGLRKLRLLLFGGEPLLNPRGCVELLSRAGDCGLSSAWMVSNATLLTPELARKLSALGLESIQVTFDGDREDHDQIRVRRSDGGTFDDIVRNIVRASEAAPIRWMLRVNVSHHNDRGIDALVDRLATALPTDRCTIRFAQVGDVGVGYVNELLHSGELAARFTGWQRRALDHGFSVARPRAHEPCLTCGYADGRYGAVVNANGTLSSCWETAGKPDWEVGAIADGYLPSSVTEERWVACEDLYLHDEEGRALGEFRDAVDTALLDYLDETGRL